MRVAMATGRHPLDVLRDPYHETLWTFYHLQQHERIVRFERRVEALHHAGLTHLAMNEPAKLKDEHERLLAEVGLRPSAQERLADAATMIAEVAALDAALAEREESDG